MDYGRLWLFLPQILTAATITAVALLCLSGVGRLAVGTPVGLDPGRTVGAQFLAGFVIYATIFALLVQLGSPFALAAALTGILLLFGLVMVVLSMLWSESGLRWRFGLASSLAGAMFVCGAARASSSFIDAYHYAFSAASLFRGSWDHRQALSASTFQALREIFDLNAYTRASDEALLWPLALLGQGVSVYDIHRTTIFLIVVAFVLLVDLLRPLAPLTISLVLAAGGIGVFTMRAASQAGQINQATAMVIVLGAVWFTLRLEDVARRRVLLLLCGYVLVSGYPEFLLVVPLYFLATAAVQPSPPRSLIYDGLSFCCGVLVAIVTTRLLLWNYLSIQSTAEIGLRVIGSIVDSAPSAWGTMLFQEAPPLWVLVVALPLLWVTHHLPSASLPAMRRLEWMVVGTILLGWLWTWLILRSPTPQYAAFKIGGWIGPGLILLSWASLQHLRPSVAPVLGAAILAFALVRAAFVPEGVLREHPQDWLSPLLAAEAIAPVNGSCVIEVPSTARHLIFRSVAEMAVPARDCLVSVSLSHDVASTFGGSPPASVAMNRTVTYPLSVFNASTDTWSVTGSAPVSVGVRFTRPEAPGGDYLRARIPDAVPPGAWMPIQVTVNTPATPGWYLLEHRVVKETQVWSQQALINAVWVE